MERHGKGPWPCASSHGNDERTKPVHNRREPLIKTGRVSIVLELERDLQDPPRWWRLLASIPGHEGVRNHMWLTTDGRLDENQMTDLATCMARAASDSILSSEGIQLVFDTQYPVT
jgi:hypothetical protein